MGTELTTSEKIKIALGRTDMTLKDLAEKVGTTRQNLHNKLTRNNFSEKDLQEIAHALGAKLEITFIFDENNKI